MIVENTKKAARDVFDSWFPLFAKDIEKDNQERLFEYFHSGYLAGTRYGNLTDGAGEIPTHSIAIDDINRDLNI